MQNRIMAVIMACSIMFAILPLCTQAENNLDFSTEIAEAYADTDASASLFAAIFEGEGTAENPYLLSTPQHFSLLAALVNNGNTTYNSAYYKLKNSIDFKNVSSFMPIGKVYTKLDYPGEGDFAPYKTGSYSLSANISASIDTVYGAVDVGSNIFSGASVDIDKNGKATLKLKFRKAVINLADDTTANFFVSDAYGDGGVKQAGTIGYLKDDGTAWVNYGSVSSDKFSITRSSSSDVVVPSYELDEGVSGVRYITQISFLLDAKRDTYSLALAVDSNVVGAQLGGETDNPVTLSIDWSLFSAPIYSESEYTEKITAKRPFSGHLDGNGYALKNITINTSERLVGVFGYGYNASVENLRIENISINAKRDYTINIGGLFGCFEGNWQADDIHITGCHIDGKITADGEKNVFTGGLVGAHKVNLNAAVVKDCRVDVDIVSVAGTTSYVGGMIGTIETGIDLSQCVVTGSAYGEAEGDANPYTGGISARLVYDDWIGTTLGVEDAVLMAEQGYSIAARLVSSIQVQSVGVYRPLIGNTFSKVLGGAEASNCYYDAQHAVTGTLDSHAGIEKTKAELFDKAFLSNTIGLDFDNTWTMVLGVPELISKEPYIAYEYEGTSFNIQPVNCGNCTVYAAAYDTYGRMLEARIAPFTEGNPVTVSFDGAAFKTVKFFALGEGNSPICESESYTAE